MGASGLGDDFDDSVHNNNIDNHLEAVEINNDIVKQPTNYPLKKLWNYLPSKQRESDDLKA